MPKVTAKIQIVFYFLMFLLFLEADAITECKMDNSNRTVTFSSLLEFQSTGASFDPDDSTFQGNIVQFNFKSIDRIPRNAFISFGSKKVLKISINNKGIRVIDDGAFNNLFCLHYLELRHNNISSLTADVFKGLDNVWMLDLSENNFQRISENGMIFHTLYKLKTLDVSKNMIVTLNAFDFFNLTRLELLNLSFNKITIIPPDLFDSLHSLKELLLNNNHLTDIEPEKWKNLNNLEVLNLAGNFLRKFDPTYNFSFVNLKSLNISQNSLNYLNVFDLRKSLAYLKSIDISMNDWYCYDLESIKHYLADSKITVLGEVNCSIIKDYKHPTTVELLSTTSANPRIPISTTITPENKETQDSLKKVLDKNKEVLNASNKILQNVQALETLLGCLCAILIVFVLISIALRIGLCRNLYNRIVDHTSHEDRQRLISRS